MALGYNIPVSLSQAIASSISAPFVIAYNSPGTGITAPNTISPTATSTAAEGNAASSAPLPNGGASTGSALPIVLIVMVIAGGLALWYFLKGK